MQVDVHGYQIKAGDILHLGKGETFAVKEVSYDRDDPEWVILFSGHRVFDPAMKVYDDSIYVVEREA